MSQKKKKGNSSEKFSPLALVAGLIFLGMVGYLITDNSKADSQLAYSGSAGAVNKVESIPVANRDNLIETRPVMNGNLFKPSVGQVYQWASEIPEVFDGLYCFCKCKENPRFRHKNLLTCYTDTHASMCGICLNEGRIAHEMHDKGKSIPEIRSYIKSYYSK